MYDTYSCAGNYSCTKEKALLLMHFRIYAIRNIEQCLFLKIKIHISNVYHSSILIEYLDYIYGKEREKYILGVLFFIRVCVYVRERKRKRERERERVEGKSAQRSF